MKYLIKNRLEQFKGTVVSTEISNEENLKFSLEDGLNKIYKLLLNLKNKKGNLYIIGNGGSAAIASHAVIDFMNVANISAHTLHDSASLTCMANDYGYENSFAKILNFILKKEDVLIIVSSSGKSKNMINAGKIVKEIGSILITLSGFNSKNTLRTLGDINIWSNSEDYGIVEVTHQFILHNLADRFLNATIVK